MLCPIGYCIMYKKHYQFSSLTIWVSISLGHILMPKEFQFAYQKSVIFKYALVFYTILKLTVFIIYKIFLKLHTGLVYKAQEMIHFHMENDEKNEPQKK